jgi:hypothetical protein
LSGKIDFELPFRKIEPGAPGPHNDSQAFKVLFLEPGQIDFPEGRGNRFSSSQKVGVHFLDEFKVRLS